MSDDTRIKSFDRLKKPEYKEENPAKGEEDVERSVRKRHPIFLLLMWTFGFSVLLAFSKYFLLGEGLIEIVIAIIKWLAILAGAFLVAGAAVVVAIKISLWRSRRMNRHRHYIQRWDDESDDKPSRRRWLNRR